MNITVIHQACNYCAAVSSRRRWRKRKELVPMLATRSPTVRSPILVLVPDTLTLLSATCILEKIKTRSTYSAQQRAGRRMLRDT